MKPDDLLIVDIDFDEEGTPCLCDVCTHPAHTDPDCFCSETICQVCGCCTYHCQCEGESEYLR